MTEKCSGCGKLIKTGEKCLYVINGVMGMLSEGKKFFYHPACMRMWK